MVAVCSLLGVSLEAQPIGTRHNADLDFSTFESYDWSASRRSDAERDPQDPLYPGSGLDLAIRAAIESALEGRGLSRSERDPDLVLHYEAVLGDHVEAAADGEVLTGARVPVSAGDLAGLPPTRQGTMVITLELPDGTFAWSGVGRQKGQALSNDDELAKRTSKLAARIVARYPPGHSNR